MSKDNWTRDQTIVALDVYCRIPFGQASNNNGVIVNAAKIIGRSPSSVKMKVGNFGSFDPKLKAQGIVGLSNASRLDKEVWEQYCNSWDKLSYDSAVIQATFLNAPIEEFCKIDINKLPEGKERGVMIKQRINQNFFRDAVLSSYSYRCCITGLSCVNLLEACHIIDWAVDKDNRTNPENGLCLNTLFHRAYDQHLIGITPDCEIRVSSALLSTNKEQTMIADFFQHYNNKKILLPNRFMPSKKFLEIRYQKYLSVNNG